MQEGFGIPVLEGMACGVPVVTSNTSALPEVAGGAAKLVDPHEIDSIAGGISEVLSNEALRNKLINAGYNRIKDFTPEALAKKTIDVYKKVLSRCHGA